MKPRRVLSMWQPWASFLLYPRNALPVKRWETRAFPPRQKLPLEIAIHATLRKDGIRDLMCFPQYIEAQNRAGIHHFPLGMIIGTATIVEVVPTERINSGLQTQAGTAPDKLDSLLGNYSPGRYAWRMAFAQVLPHPIPFKGRQAVLWELDAETDRAIDEQLGRPLR
jgi:hypothetical protein